jgi:ribosome-associated protein
MKSDQLLKLAVEATENKKAEDIISLNMQGISDMTFSVASTANFNN